MGGGRTDRALAFFGLFFAPGICMLRCMTQLDVSHRLTFAARSLRRGLLLLSRL